MTSDLNQSWIIFKYHIVMVLLLVSGTSLLIPGLLLKMFGLKIAGIILLVNKNHDKLIMVQWQ